MKIAIIIPCNNSDEILERCFKSLKNQTKKEYISVYLINDCSNKTKDNFQSLIQKYSVFFEIKYFKTKEPSGPSVARNIGLKNILEKWVTFMDADDWLYDEYVIENYLKILNNNQLDNIASIHFTILDQHDNDIIYRKASEEHQFWMHSKLFSKNFLDKYNINFNEKLKYRFEDIFFTLQTYIYSIKENYKILDFDDIYTYVLYHDRQHSSLTYDHTLTENNFLYSKSMNLNLFYDIIFYHQLLLFYKQINNIHKNKQEIFNILEYFYLNCNNILLLLNIYGLQEYSQDELQNFYEAIIFFIDLVNKNLESIDTHINNKLNFSMAGYETEKIFQRNFIYLKENFEKQWIKMI